MKAKLIMISGSSCAGCSSLHIEVQEVLKNFPNIPYEECSIDTKTKQVQTLLDQYHIDKIPTLLLLDDEHELGKVSGYQPAEILSLWLEDKLQ